MPCLVGAAAVGAVFLAFIVGVLVGYAWGSHDISWASYVRDWMPLGLYLAAAMGAVPRMPMPDVRPLPVRGPGAVMAALMPIVGRVAHGMAT